MFFELLVHCKFDLKIEIAYQIAKLLCLKIKKRCCLYVTFETNSDFCSIFSYQSLVHIYEADAEVSTVSMRIRQKVKHGAGGEASSEVNSEATGVLHVTMLNIYYYYLSLIFHLE